MTNYLIGYNYYELKSYKVAKKYLDSVFFLFRELVTDEERSENEKFTVLATLLLEKIDHAENVFDPYEIKPEIVKHLLQRAVEISYDNKDPLPYEYICWESILLDIEPKRPEIELEKKELCQKDIDKLCLNDFVQNWFFDEITSPEFKTFIEKLSNEFKKNNFDVDIDKYIANNFNTIYTAKELTYQLVSFKIAAYLRLTKNDKELATILYSLDSNYSFLTNILRKSIYEYYVAKRYLLKNQKQTKNKFEQKMQSDFNNFELLQLDMIIASIEARWVNHA
jgi:hypothetical protein